MPKNISRRAILGQAARALTEGLTSSNPGTVTDEKGYVTAIEYNLVPGIGFAQFEDELRAGDGDELNSKFRAAHSSSALCVNAFAPFKDHPRELEVAGVNGFRELMFERKCPTGLIGRKSPNLDFLAEGRNHIMAIESKCTEYLSPHVAKFSRAYRDQIKDARRDGPWFADMLRLLDEPDYYKFLDAAQLIKHAFGVERTFPGKDKTLLYLFWEPTNADEFSVFQHHRAEIDDFADRIGTGSLRFKKMSYADLWNSWDENISTAWITRHTAALRARYLVSL